MSFSLPPLSSHYLNTRLGQLGLLIGAAAVLQLATAVGLAYVAGFGGFLAYGGAALDTYALEAAGADEREAKVRCLAWGAWSKAC
jgi:hypothetical protein